MNAKKLVAIGFIFIGATIAWMILGAVTSSRTDTQTKETKRFVENLYGGKQTVKQPSAEFQEPTTKTRIKDGKTETYVETVNTTATLEKSVIRADIKLDPRKKGNIWHPTYTMKYRAEYEIKNPTARTGTLKITLPLGSSDSDYDNIQATVNGARVDNATLVRGDAIWRRVQPNERVRIAISYDTTGMTSWRYLMNSKDAMEELKDFSLVITTDFKKIDFPTEGFLSPTEKIETENGYELSWTYTDMITGKNIGLEIPAKLTPGEIVSRVTFFAPISLLFFFFILLIITTLMKTPIHPMHFFMLACTFFSFHLIFSYFSDQMDIRIAFAVASAVALLLTSSYLRFFTPWKIAFLFAPLAELVYLVAFSFSFFFEGVTGMILTIVSVLTLFIAMQLTGNVDWESVFNRSNAKMTPPRQ